MAISKGRHKFLPERTRLYLAQTWIEERDMNRLKRRAKKEGRSLASTVKAILLDALS